MSDREQPPELTERDRAQLKAVGSVVVSLRDAFADVDGDGAFAAIQQMRQIGIDWDRVRDCLHVPEDAGEYTEGLRRILLRIPDGWGRWIRASRGWYPIIVRLDEDLAALDPDYRVHQVKEKFGGLKYYFRTEHDELRKAMYDLVEAAEAAAELVCEECGDTGPGVRMRTDHYRQQTLCDRCADSRPPARFRRPT